MSEVSALDKCRLKRKAAKSSAMKYINRVRSLIAEGGSSSKVQQFAKGIEEARDKARSLNQELEELDPSSIEVDGAWLDEVETEVKEALGEVHDYLLQAKQPVQTAPTSAAASSPATSEVRKSGLKGDKMAVQQTEQAVADLKKYLVDMPTDMRLFSLAMRSLYADKAVSSGSSAGRKFKELRDDTRKDAMVYLKGVLPLSTQFVSSISEFFEYYEALDYDEWCEMLPDILQETVGYKELATTIVKMHEDIMVPLKQREDEARIIVCELNDLQEEYKKKKKELEEKADKKRGWAIALVAVPYVSVVAFPLLTLSADKDTAEAVAKGAESKIHEAAALVISNALIPALKAFLDGLSNAASFFSVMEQELRNFESQGNKGTKQPKKLFYKLMNKQARDMKTTCQGFYAVLPSVRTDFLAIPTDSSDQNYVDKWLEKQKKEIESRITIKSLALSMLKALKGDPANAQNVESVSTT